MNDDLLSAWLDDELDPEARARVEAWLRDHPDDAARVRLWAADRDALRARFDPVLDEPLPSALAQQPWRRSWAPRAWQAAAALALFAGGAVLGALWRDGPAPAELAAADTTWVHRAAAAHAVYVPEQRHPVEVRAQEEHLARWLTRRTALPVKLFDLREQGFELVGGRLLPDAGASPSAQLMYQDAAGQRVTVYLRKPEPGTAAAFRYERDGELGLFYWVEDGCGYALAGTLPRERLLALAQAIYRQHEAAR